MTNKELRKLLENAARACGIVLDFNIRGDNVPYYINSRGGHSSWQPHIPGLDSQVLAAELHIDVEWFADHVRAGMRAAFIAENYADHPSKTHAQAMAVLRVAAQIGEAM